MKRLRLSVYTLLLVILFQSVTEASSVLIAHRGVHQTYHREKLTNETCTAKRIDIPRHDYLENTLPSMEEAFKYGADVVEIDIHPTTEPDGLDELVVFHDWTLECRTNARCDEGCNCNSRGQCITNEQTLEYLQSLDLAYGYTSDGGKTYPLRGVNTEVMPHFQDVLNLLKAFPDKRILVNVKGNTERSFKAFKRIISYYPMELRSRVLYPIKYGHGDELAQLGVGEAIDQNAKKCLFDYLKTGWYGHFPKSCHQKKIFIPVRETMERLLGRPGRYLKVTSFLWGWPESFIKKAHEAGTEVYASQVDSIELYKEYSKYDLDGIMTNRIEIIGPSIIRN